MVPSEIHLEPDLFTKMYNLRFLEFYCPDQDFHKLRYFNKRFIDEEGKLQLLCQGLQSLPKNLSYLHWTKFPLKSIPSKFFPDVDQMALAFMDGFDRVQLRKQASTGHNS